MKVIIKYKVEKPFRDKYTKEDIVANAMIDVSIERMKELNAANVGRAEDVIVVIEELENSKETKVEEDNTSNEGNNTTQVNTKKYTQEKLEAINVNDLKKLAAEEGIELTKAKKDEIIIELLEKLK